MVAEEALREEKKKRRGGRAKEAPVAQRRAEAFRLSGRSGEKSQRGCRRDDGTRVEEAEWAVEETIAIEQASRGMLLSHFGTQIVCCTPIYIITTTSIQRQRSCSRRV